VDILLMTIGAYFVNGYWWLLMLIILVAIGGYFINFYWWILMIINGYYINGYWWILVVINVIKLVAIILMAINDYSIVSHYGYFIGGY
jgi:hypothetical protein